MELLHPPISVRDAVIGGPSRDSRTRFSESKLLWIGLLKNKCEAACNSEKRVQQGSPADEADVRGSYQSVIINGQELLVGGKVHVAIDGQSTVSFEDLSAFAQ